MEEELNKKEIKSLRKILEKELPGRGFKYLGEGNLSCVFLADYYSKKAAVKIYQEKVCKGDVILPFQKHKIDLTKIEHPNLMKVYEVLPSGTVISEYCGNENNFRDKIYYNNSLEKNLISYWGLLKAVKYLVSKGLAHTDLKLENIMFESNSSTNPKIIDYDTMSKTGKKQFKDNICFITTGVGAPEIVGKKINKKTDIFSLGTILYEITQEINPFEVLLKEWPTKFIEEHIKKFKTRFGLYLISVEEKTPPYHDISIGNNVFIKELITKMRKFYPVERPSINRVMDIFDSAMPKEIRRELN